MSKFDDFAVDPLFIAVPELAYNVRVLDLMLSQGIIDSDQYSRIKEATAGARKAELLAGAAMKEGPLIARLLAVGGELLTVSSVNVLRSLGLLSETQGHALRIAIRTLKATTRGGLPTDTNQIFTRLGRIIGAQVSNERIDLWRSMGLIDETTGNRWRGYIRNGKGAKEALNKVVRSKSILDALIVLGEYRPDKFLVAQMVRSGVLPARLGAVYGALFDLGFKEWKVFSGAGAEEGFRRRALLVLTGSFNAQLLDALLAARIIDRDQYAGLQLVETIARNVNDNLLQDLTKRRYRVRAGEAPIKTFARATRSTDAEILRLLAQAARESAKEAEALAALPGIGARVRASQYNLAARGLHQSMRNMWDGVGYLSIWGESRVAEAAVESAAMLNSKLLKGLPADVRQSILYQSKAGVDSYISREENTLKLSRLVYKNRALFEGKVDQRIKLGLLRGQSAEEIARDVEKFISPNTPGGSAYAARRLARTEINNAFHYNFIRNTREQPWVRGYQWKTSSSHGRPDVCNSYADEDHDGLGPGVFKKANVPGKPHPQCLCYITVVSMDELEFTRAFQAGRFNSYLAAVEKGRTLGADAGLSSDFGSYARSAVGSLVPSL